MAGPEDLAATYQWFEHNSGWAPPDPETLADWLSEGICRCPDDCMVDAGGTCEHGLASWASVLDAQHPR
jgi:hypothetical protein